MTAAPKISTDNTARATLLPTDATVVVRVVFLYVGQGSSVLVLFRDRATYRSVLIDSNLDRKANGLDIPRLIKDLLADDSLHAFVNTHPHDDHLTGIKELAEAVTISEVWHSNHKPSKKHGARYSDLLAVINELDDSKITELLGSRTAAALGDGQIHVLAPAEYVNDDVNEEDADARYQRIHENCAVIKVGTASQWVMITGDADLRAFRDHITPYHKEALSAYVLDAPHHGSRSFFVTSEGDDPYIDHIKAISPAFVIVSAPKQSESRHDHPHDDAVDLYERYAQVLHMGPKRECFICDIHEDGTADDPRSDEGKLVEAYGFTDDGGDGGDDLVKRGPFVKPTAPAAPRDGRYA